MAMRARQMHVIALIATVALLHSTCCWDSFGAEDPLLTRAPEVLRIQIQDQAISPVTAPR